MCINTTAGKTDSVYFITGSIALAALHNMDHKASFVMVIWLFVVMSPSQLLELGLSS